MRQGERRRGWEAWKGGSGNHCPYVKIASGAVAGRGQSDHKMYHHNTWMEVKGFETPKLSKSIIDQTLSYSYCCFLLFYCNIPFKCEKYLASEEWRSWPFKSSDFGVKHLLPVSGFERWQWNQWIYLIMSRMITVICFLVAHHYQLIFSEHFFLFI